MITRTVLFCGALVQGASLAAQVPGDLDPSFSGDGIATVDFGAGNDDTGTGVAIQPDGRIVVVGSTQDLVSTQTSMALTRFMPDGSLDASFGTGGKVVTTVGTLQDGATAVALQPDGKIVVAGFSLANGTGDRFLVARYDATGVLDPSFGTNGIHVINGLNGGRYGSIVIDDLGRILAAGVINEAPSNEMFIVARYLSNGTPDPSFNGNGFRYIDISADDDAANDIELEPGGSILVCGYTGLGTDMNMALVRLTENGTLDNSLDGDGVVVTQLSTDQDAATSIVRLPNKILVSGHTTFLPMVFMLVASYNLDGSLDNSFAGDGIFQSPHPGLNLVGSMLRAPDGRIVLGGTWATNFLLAMVNPDGTADNGFGDDGVVTTSFGQNAYGNDLALQTDGKAILVGRSGQGIPTGNDVVVLRYHTGVGVGLQEADEPGTSVLVVPNPTVGAFELRFELARAQRITVTVCDAQGRVADVLLSGAMRSSGPQRLRSAPHEAWPSGAYVITVSGEEGTIGRACWLKR